MERPRNEVHVDSDEARAGSTQNTVRWILGVGLLLIVVAFTIIVLIGGASQSDREDDQTLKVQAQDQAGSTGTDTDGIVSGDADTIRNAPDNAGQVQPGRVPN